MRDCRIDLLSILWTALRRVKYGPQNLKLKLKNATALHLKLNRKLHKFLEIDSLCVILHNDGVHNNRHLEN